MIQLYGDYSGRLIWEQTLCPPTTPKNSGPSDPRTRLRTTHHLVHARPVPRSVSAATMSATSVRAV